MTERPEFTPWPKIARLNKPIVVTEKIDGTNAAVVITEDAIYAQSRTRFITVGDDNFGFAAWVAANEDSLRADLGCGVHAGEWWGSKIQRGYGLVNGERRFSLFNTGKWHEHEVGFGTPELEVVPIIYHGPFSGDEITASVKLLDKYGSYAEPGFMKPEGIVVYHTAANLCFKVLIEGDDVPKGLQA